MMLVICLCQGRNLLQQSDSGSLPPINPDTIGANLLLGIADNLKTFLNNPSDSLLPLSAFGLPSASDSAAASTSGSRIFLETTYFRLPPSGTIVKLFSYMSTDFCSVLRIVRLSHKTRPMRHLPSRLPETFVSRAHADAANYLSGLQSGRLGQAAAFAAQVQRLSFVGLPCRT